MPFYVLSLTFLKKYFGYIPFVLNLQLLKTHLEYMKIDQNKTVSLIYKLREADINGKILEELQESRPLKFIFGTGRLLPAFEENLVSLNSGDNFSFNLNADQAYGRRREERIVDVPLSIFKNEGEVDENICRVGNDVPLTDDSGNPFYGTIIEICEDSVKMDFNHPMAGVDLFFSGKILEVREPTSEEMSELESSCSGCEGRIHSGCDGNCN